MQKKKKEKDQIGVYCLQMHLSDAFKSIRLQCTHFHKLLLCARVIFI